MESLPVGDAIGGAQAPDDAKPFELVNLALGIRSFYLQQETWPYSCSCEDRMKIGNPPCGPREILLSQLAKET